MAFGKYFLFVSVRTCSGGDTSAAVSTSFSTPCAPVAAPYSESFSSGSLPTCFSLSARCGHGSLLELQVMMLLIMDVHQVFTRGWTIQERIRGHHADG